jgi:hypothetical protein
MPPANTPESRRDVVGVARQGRTPLNQVAKDFGLAGLTLTDGDEINGLVAHLRERMDESKLSGARWAIGHPGHSRSIAHWLRDLPKVAIAPADDLAGRVLRKRFGGIGMLKTGRHAQAALVLPANPEDYWKGQKRKVFRNKVASSERSGLTRRLLGPGETADAVQAICDGRGWNRDMRSEMEGLLEIPLESALASGSFSPDGAVLSVCVAVASGDVAQIRWGLSVVKGSARWAAFAGLLDGAYASGFTTLLVGPMIGVASEDEYFQRRIGFRPSNIELAVSRWPKLTTNSPNLHKLARASKQGTGFILSWAGGQRPPLHVDHQTDVG